MRKLAQVSQRDCPMSLDKSEKDFGLINYPLLILLLFFHYNLLGDQVGYTENANKISSSHVTVT